MYERRVGLHMHTKKKKKKKREGISTGNDGGGGGEWGVLQYQKHLAAP